ncbi:TonB-dependent receptor plug domain-containing protein [Affinibrenneria salicis]|uniref:TonB-dependent receptor plug domain-containing protein n=1 Tax=Affinibrenneria salicis TaxID=2590031 RepID=A0A5J5FTJ7_9GAMM|nr:TonB-dependent receptor [Affinibrenneria salicis]KAA8996655.1 TonB-dependent receptor plug domain-containing protein [Affinibrenneria salicis]
MMQNGLHFSLRPMPLSVGILLSALAGTVMADESKSHTRTDKNTANNANSSTDIVVTANEPQETATFSTPAAISTVKGKTLEREGIQHLSDVAQRLPNVYLSDFLNGPGTIIIRGQGHHDEEADVASVKAQIDGVPLPLTSMVGGLYDLEQIEVQRGPENLLYGENSTGGMLVMRSRDPEFRFGGSVQTEYGSGNRRRLMTSLNVPLSTLNDVYDSTALRITAGRELANGYIDNTRLGRDDTAGWRSSFARLKLLHYDTEGGEWRFALHHMDRKGGSDLFSSQALARRHETTESDSGINNIKYTLFSGEYLRPLDENTAIKASLGASAIEWNYWTPVSLFGATNGYDMKTKGYNADTRIERTASDDSPFDWMAGLHVAITDLDRPYLYDYTPYFRSATTSQVDGLTTAAFGEAGWHFAPDWRLAAGLRMSRDSRKLEWSSDQNGYVQSLNKKVIDNVWLPQITLEYRPDEQQFTWLKLARGYKPSGFNVYATSASTAEAAYKPEYANYAELGYRVKDAQNLWGFGAVAFYSRIRNQQVVLEGLGGAHMTANAGRSHAQGAELETSFRPFSQLELRGSVGYVKTVYDEYTSGGTNYAGMQFMAAPKVTYSLGARWMPTENWESGISVSHISSVYLPTSYLKDDGYTLVDANVSWRHKDWTIGVFGKNLTDTKYLTRSISSGDLVVAGPPRTFGLQLAYDF